MMIKDYRLLKELCHIHIVQIWKSMQSRAARISKYIKCNFDDVTNKNKI